MRLTSTPSFNAIVILKKKETVLILEIKNAHYSYSLLMISAVLNNSL